MQKIHVFQSPTHLDTTIRRAALRPAIRRLRRPLWPLDQTRYCAADRQIEAS